MRITISSSGHLKQNIRNILEWITKRKEKEMMNLNVNLNSIISKNQMYDNEQKVCEMKYKDR